MGQETKLVEQFDKDGDKRLNSEERRAARASLDSGGRPRGPGGGRRFRGGPPGGFGRPGGNDEPVSPGVRLAPSDVKIYGDAPLYDSKSIRTLFLEFQDSDWEAEMGAFNNTDVEIPADLTVDGQVYKEVGVHFRGASSFMMVSEGHKRSLNISLDFAHKDQALGGYRTLNLLNSHDDPTFLRSVLFLDIARHYLPAPKANFARVVINGESWGLYVNVQQFNKDFVKEWFGTTQGARWKVPGSPRGRGSLAYLGEDIESYKGIYTIKSKDTPKAWNHLVKLCRTLNETPSEKLQAALAPLLDIDGALKFLALENALINNDGYWVRTSDYGIYQDPKGLFHILPHDVNETFSIAGGPGFGRGPGPGGGAPTNGLELDPLIAAEDPQKPLISKLLAVPAFRERYLRYVREIAERWLDWDNLEPLARGYHEMIAPDVKADTRKLESTEAFVTGLADSFGQSEDTGRFPMQRSVSLKDFANQRRAYLLNHNEIKHLPR